MKSFFNKTVSTYNIEDTFPPCSIAVGHLYNLRKIIHPAPVVLAIFTISLPFLFSVCAACDAGLAPWRRMHFSNSNSTITPAPHKYVDIDLNNFAPRVYDALVV